MLKTHGSFCLKLVSSCVEQINLFQSIKNNPPRFVYGISHLISAVDPDYMVTRFNNKFQDLRLNSDHFAHACSILCSKVKAAVVRRNEH